MASRSFLIRPSRRSAIWRICTWRRTSCTRPSPASSMIRRRGSTQGSKTRQSRWTGYFISPPGRVLVCRSTRPNWPGAASQSPEARKAMAVSRCGWATDDPLYIAYHDREWGTPLHDDRGLFELLILEGAQAGLSWITILRKRESYRAAFDSFEPSKIAGYGERKLAELLDNPGIIRNRLKIEAAVLNAKAFVEVQRHFGSFDTYIWQFVNHTPVQNAREDMGDVPSSSKESDAMSKDLRKRGFKFVGTTICYAFMQAAGMVNDHVVDCFRYAELAPPQLKR